MKKIDTTHLDELEKEIVRSLNELRKREGSLNCELVELSKAAANCAKARNELGQSRFFPSYARDLRRLTDMCADIFKQAINKMGFGPPSPPDAGVSNPESN